MTTPDSPPPHRWVGMIVLALYVVTGVFPYLVSGLVVPIWALVLLMLCWGIGLGFTARLALRRPLMSMLALPSVLLFWWVYVSGGSALFGWTA
jgi:hypothetical protein